MSGSILTDAAGIIEYNPFFSGASYTLASYSTPFTLEMYIYPTTADLGVYVYIPLFSVGDAPNGDSPDNVQMQFGYIGDTQQLYYQYNDFSPNVMTAAAVVLNKWNYVTWVSNGTTMTAYLNGIAGTPFTISSTSGTATSVNTDPTYNVGYLASDSNYPFAGASYTGYQTNLRYVNGTALYSGNFYPPLSPLLAITNTQLLLSVNSAPTYLTDSSIYNTPLGYASPTVSYSSLSPFNAASLMWVGI